MAAIAKYHSPNIEKFLSRYNFIKFGKIDDARYKVGNNHENNWQKKENVRSSLFYSCVGVVKAKGPNFIYQINLQHL